MAKVFTSNRRVEFCETDAAGIAHFSALMCYMEQAEHAMLRSLGTSVVQPLDDGWHLSWPRVHVGCDYQGVARFEDELEIDVQVAKLGNKSVTYVITIKNAGKAIATGRVVAVCCRVKVGQPLESTPIPAPLAEQLATFFDDSLA
ncbi:MAG: thioesterase family protein [Aureliella sp.]